MRRIAPSFPSCTWERTSVWRTYFSFLAFQFFSFLSETELPRSDFISSGDALPLAAAPEYEAAGARQYYEPLLERTFTRRQGKAAAAVRIATNRKG
ncbi:MAG: hypothetical protein DME97_06895 [Verrucomicrobia bacterium]|nr:MAG: hypothetical protein DME97_06895 [Verrucomicrobiota bacterium]